MKIVHGTPNSVFSIGVSKFTEDADPMPFIAFGTKEAIGDAEVNKVHHNVDALDDIDSKGGAVIFFENPEAFISVIQLLRYLAGSVNIQEWLNQPHAQGVMQ